MARVLIDLPSLADRIDDPQLVVVDCRFSLADPEQGRRAYLEGHLPGAIYVHLEGDLSGPIVRGKTGRHPLPDPEWLAERVSSLGIGDDCGVVAYDDTGGAFAARLWWLLRWLGHEPVRVLDGGLQSWRAQDLAIESGNVTLEPMPFTANPQTEMVATAEDSAIAALAGRLFDARSAERYAGREEPIDAVAGHIPGAISLPFGDSLGEDGFFRSAFELRKHFDEFVGQETTQATDIAPTCYCGSGVTAAHLALAMQHSGLPMPRLYVGSWSEWITDRKRPIEK